MANIKHRMQSTLHNLYQQGRGQKKKEDPDHRFIHSKVTLQTYLREVDRFSDWLKAQGVKMRCTEQEAARQVPAYLQSLIQAGARPTPSIRPLPPSVRPFRAAAWPCPSFPIHAVPMHRKRAAVRPPACTGAVTPMSCRPDTGGWWTLPRRLVCAGTSMPSSGDETLSVSAGKSMC